MADNLIYKDVVIRSLGDATGVVMGHVNLGGPAKYRVATPFGEMVFPMADLVLVRN